MFLKVIKSIFAFGIVLVSLFSLIQTPSFAVEVQVPSQSLPFTQCANERVFLASLPQNPGWYYAVLTSNSIYTCLGPASSDEAASSSSNSDPSRCFSENAQFRLVKGNYYGTRAAKLEPYFTDADVRTCLGF